MKKIQILSVKSELALVKQLGFLTTTASKNINSQNIVVRWGHSRILGKEFPYVINSGKVISLNCHKQKALQKLREVVLTPEEYLKEVPAGKKAVIRPIEHTAGNSFSIVSGPYQIPEYHYGTEFIQTTKEYRVWFCGGKTFVALRVPLNDNDHKAFPCRSNWGYSYRFNFDRTISNQTLLAAETIGLECGAADILEKDGKYYFLELNSAPSIDTGMLIKFFKKNLIGLINKKFGTSFELTNS